MYQKNNYSGFGKIGTTEQWQNEGILSEFLSFEPTTSLAFTPTTLATMESTLATFENEMVSDGDTNSDDDDDDSNMSFEPTPSKRSKTSSGVSSSTSPRRLPGPKSSIRTEDMTPEEIQRRQRRRERNKQAAARCRQRRIDITNQLLAETQQLEADAQRLEREIENLQKQRDQLEFVLEAHRPSCCGDIPEIKPEHIAVNPVNQASAVASAVRPSTLPISNKMVPTTLDSAAFSFDLGSTGFTPVVSSSGMGIFLGSSSDFASPTTLLLSPSTLLAQ